jgi:cytoskeletal protein RodZ
MSELGQLLVEARTARGWDLADVEAATRIRQKYLDALENGRFADLPRGAVARGFLRTYARFLDLDVEDLIRRYTQESGDVGNEVPIAEPGKPRLVDYRPLEVELMDTRPTMDWLYWVIALVIVAAIGGGGWWALNRNVGWNPLAAFGPEPTATPTPTATRWVVTATPRPSPTNTATVPAPTSDLLPLPTPTVEPTMTPTPSPTFTPEVVAQIALEMRIAQRAWVKVVVDGEIVEQKTLEAGESRFWEASQSIFIRTGNGAGVILTLNGEELGAMGKVGEVVERVWVVDQGQVTESTSGVIVAPAGPTGTPTPAG